MPSGCLRLTQANRDPFCSVANLPDGRCTYSAAYTPSTGCNANQLPGFANAYPFGYCPGPGAARISDRRGRDEQNQR